MGGTTVPVPPYQASHPNVSFKTLPRLYGMSLSVPGFNIGFVSHNRGIMGAESSTPAITTYIQGLLHFG